MTQPKNIFELSMDVESHAKNLQIDQFQGHWNFDLKKVDVPVVADYLMVIITDYLKQIYNAPKVKIDRYKIWNQVEEDFNSDYYLAMKSEMMENKGSDADITNPKEIFKVTITKETRPKKYDIQQFVNISNNGAVLLIENLLGFLAWFMVSVSDQEQLDKVRSQWLRKLRAHYFQLDELKG